MLGIIVGTGFNLLEKTKTIKTKYGISEVVVSKNFVFLQRHGKNKNIPPHKINHKANLFALKKLNIEEIISVNSVGSLKIEIPPKNILIPNDFFCPWQTSTFYDKEIRHITPEINEDLRNKIIDCAKKVGINVIENGIYAQTIGPRLETKAEISFLSKFADVVGMTMVSECVLANEIGIKFASICTVDNYANGITSERLNFERIKENAKNNSKNVRKILKEIIKENE